MFVGIIDCWVFLSCLEVLNKCEKFFGFDFIKSYFLYIVSLWDYVRKKVRKNIQDEILLFNYLNGDWDIFVIYSFFG